MKEKGEVTMAANLTELYSKSGEMFRELPINDESGDIPIRFAVPGGKRNTHSAEKAYFCTWCNKWIVGEPEVVKTKEIGGCPPEMIESTKSMCGNCGSVFGIKVLHYPA